MIFGECPNCDAFINYPMPETSPKFIKLVCEECKQPYWLLCSRLSPEAYSQEAFDEEFVVDEETKAITRRKL